MTAGCSGWPGWRRRGAGALPRGGSAVALLRARGRGTRAWFRRRCWWSRGAGVGRSRARGGGRARGGQRRVAPHDAAESTARSASATTRIASPADEPVILYAEIDSDGWEWRKVDEYHDGRLVLSVLITVASPIGPRWVMRPSRSYQRSTWKKSPRGRRSPRASIRTPPGTRDAAVRQVTRVGCCRRRLGRGA